MQLGELLSQTNVGEDDENSFEPAANDMEGVDPLLSPLESNGNMTATHKLMQGSPAFNTGDPNDQFNDQNDQEVFGSRRDIGADEAQSDLSTATDDISIADSGIKVFPNPVHTQLKIEIPSDFGKEVTLKLYEMNSGRLIKSEKVNSSNVTLYLDDLKSQMYSIRLISENYSTSQNFVKIN